MIYNAYNKLENLLFISIFVLLAALPATAESYKLSGSADGTGTFVVDDGLAVYLNGVEIYNDGGASSGARQPIAFTANIGDQLRFAVHDTFGDCRSLSRPPFPTLG